MRGFAAILRFDGAPVDRQDVVAMCAAGPSYPGGFSSWWQADGATIAGRAPVAGPSPGPAGIIHDSARHLAFLFDGRLDNREELAAALHMPSDLPDDRLALEAAAVWDVDAPRRLIGDYAFILWDILHRRAVVARDHLGIRPLYFHTDRQRLVCAGELAQVLASRDVPREPDTGTVALHLSSRYPRDSSTLFRGVHRLPAAHAAVIDQNGPRLVRYWDATPQRAIRYASDGEYAEHCRELLVRATAARMRDVSRVAVTLSGGVDSSAVAVAANCLIDGARAQPFSLTFPINVECDERQYFTAVADRCGMPSIECPQEPVDGDTMEGWVTRSLDLAGSASDAMAEPMWRAMHARGYHVALTGVGGDSVFAGTLFYYADLIRAGRFAELMRQYRADRIAEAGATPLSLLQAGAWPALPSALKTVLRPVARAAYTVTQRSARRPWLRLDVPWPDDDRPFEPRAGSFATEGIARVVEGASSSHLLEAGSRVAGESGVELRHPLLDLRLVEFAVAIPENQRKRGSLLKYVLRRALAPELPAIVATRVSKADFMHPGVQLLTSLGESFFAGLNVAQLGWVDGAQVIRNYRSLQPLLKAGHDGDSPLVAELTGIAAVELWHRNAFGSRTA